MNYSKYLTAKQVNEKYGIDPIKIYLWARTKRIVSTRVGRSLLIPENEFLDFLRTHTFGPSLSKEMHAQ